MSVRSFIQKHEKQIGSVASIIAIVMFISIVEIALSNFRGESHIVIQPTATAVSGLLWSLYAYGHSDWFLLAPNIAALVLGTLTVVSAFV